MGRAAFETSLPLAEYNEGCALADSERWDDYIAWFLDAGTRLRAALAVVALPEAG